MLKTVEYTQIIIECAEADQRKQVRCQEENIQWIVFNMFPALKEVGGEVWVEKSEWQWLQYDDQVLTSVVSEYFNCIISD